MSMKAEVTNFDLTTKDGWDNYLKDRSTRIAERAREKEMVIADNTIIVTCDPRTGEKLPRPMGVVLVTVFAGDDDEAEARKEHFVMLSRSVAITGRAIASVHLSEAWLSQATVPNGTKPRFTCASEDPNRQEVLVMMADHREYGQEMHTALITRDGDKRIIVPWRLVGSSGPNERIVGRFASFVLPDEALNDPVLQWAAKAFIAMQSKDSLEVIELRRPDAAAS